MKQLFQRLLCKLKIHKQGTLDKQFYIDEYDKVDLWKIILYSRYKCSCCSKYFDVRIGELPPHKIKDHEHYIYNL
jgi:hypothetical protein